MRGSAKGGRAKDEREEGRNDGGRDEGNGGDIRGESYIAHRGYLVCRKWTLLCGY